VGARLIGMCGRSLSAFDRLLRFGRFGDWVLYHMKEDWVSESPSIYASLVRYVKNKRDEPSSNKKLSFRKRNKIIDV
jgi:hypothetical protein